MSRPPDLATRFLQLAAAAALGLSALRCGVMDPASERAYFNVQVPDSLAQYSRLVVVLRESNGPLIDTLFKGRMDSAAQLSRLPAPHFVAGQVRVEIQGFIGDSLAYSVARLFNPATSSIQVVPFQSGGSGVPPLGSGNTSGFALSWRDTSVSIGDSLRLQILAEATSQTPLRLRWDADGDGVWDDSLQPKAELRAWAFGFRLRRAGRFYPTAQLTLPGGSLVSFQAQVDVLLDPPVADAGADTTVPTGGTILLHAKGSDRFGPIVYREWSLNGGAYWPVPWQETKYSAPATPGHYLFVLRVTDSDSLKALDTLQVRVVAP